MTVDLALQVRGMCQAVLLGGALGVLYDLMRIARRCLPLFWLEAILDFLFWLTATAALFLFSHSAWGGQVRLYGALFCLMGGAAYFWGVSPAVLPPIMACVRFLRRVLGILTRPVGYLLHLFRRIGKFAKTSFLSRKNGV